MMSERAHQCHNISEGRYRIRKAHHQSRRDNKNELMNRTLPDNYFRSMSTFVPGGEVMVTPQDNFDGADDRHRPSLDRLERSDLAKDPIILSDITEETFQNVNERYSESENGTLVDITSSEPLKVEELNIPRTISTQAPQIQEGFEEESNPIEKGRLFSQIQSDTNGKQQGNSCITPTWDDPVVDRCLGGFDYQYSPLKPTFGCPSAGSSPVTSFDCGLGAHSEPCNDQPSFVSNTYRGSDYAPDLLHDPECQCGTNGLETLTNNPPLLSPGPQTRDDTTIDQGGQSPVTGLETQGTPATYLDIEDYQSAMNPRTTDEKSIHTPWLACPWYKKDPRRYQACAKFKLLRIKDVKQHTSRKHMEPDIYCPVCFETFAKTSDRDTHIQKKNCDPRPKPYFDGISEQERKELNQNANRGKTDVEQWYMIWDTIFPGITRPQSPYLRDGWEEFLSLLRNFWNTRRLEIISGAIQVSYPEVEFQSIQRVVDSIFDHLETEPLEWAFAHPEEFSLETSHMYNASPNSFDGAVSGDMIPQTTDTAFRMEMPALRQHPVFGAHNFYDHTREHDINTDPNIVFQTDDLARFAVECS